jgi:predicted HAD superfamily phosphohydrolase YqeG
LTYEFAETVVAIAAMDVIPENDIVIGAKIVADVLARELKRP